MINLSGLAPCAVRYFAVVELVAKIEPLPLRANWRFGGEYIQGVCLWDALQIIRVWTAAYNVAEYNRVHWEEFWNREYYPDSDIVAMVREHREGIWNNRPTTFLNPKTVNVLRGGGLVTTEFLNQVSYRRLIVKLETGCETPCGVTVRRRGVRYAPGRRERL